MTTFLRSIGAVIFGYIAMAAVVVTGTLIAGLALAGPEGGPTPAYLAVNFLVSVAAAAAGASLTMRMAPLRPRLHVAALGAGMILITIPALGGGPPPEGVPDQPEWYTLTILLLGLIGLAVGVWLTERNTGGRPHGADGLGGPRGPGTPGAGTTAGLVMIVAAGSVAAAAAGTASPATAQAPADGTGAAAQWTALRGGTLIDGTGAGPVRDATVVVRDGRIHCVGAAAACPVPEGARIIDASRRWIIPGLIDGHVHYSQTGWADGRPDALDVRSRFPYAETVHWLETHPEVLGRSYLCSGVTATFDVGGYPWTWELRSWSDTSTTMPHVEAAGPLLSTRDHWVNLPAERQFLHIPTDSAVEAGADYLIANGTSAIKVWFLVGSRSDTAALRSRMETAAAKARSAGIPLIVHATGLWDATVAVENGAHLLVHSVDDQPVDRRFLDAAREAGTLYNPTLVVRDGYVQLASRAFDPAAYGDDIACVDPTSLDRARITDELPGGVAGERLEAYRRRIAEGAEVMAENLRRVHAAGIPVVMGTDAGNPLTLHGPSVFPEMEAMAAAGLSPMDVLVAATRNAARAMGREDDLGTLEPGKVADLVVLGADPLAAISNVRAIVRVMRAGVLHGRDALEWR